MNDFMAKLSSYNLLNYLLTGVVFATLVAATSERRLVPTDPLAAIFVYYFIGLVVSRFGSIVLEPILKKAKVIKFADYKEYVVASQVDEKLDVLSEQNNVYRSMASAFALLLLLAVWSALSRLVPLLLNLEPWIGLFALLALFVFSYQKQCDYVVRRVRAVSTVVTGQVRGSD